MSKIFRIRLHVFVGLGLLALPGLAHEPAKADPAIAIDSEAALAQAQVAWDHNLDFDADEDSTGWVAGGIGYKVELDEENAHSGPHSLHMGFVEPGRFAVCSRPFPAELAQGKRLRLTGYLRTEDVASGHAGLWMRVDIGNEIQSFDNMDSRGVSGTTPWTPYEVLLDVPEGSDRIFFGAVMTGTGTAWADSFQIEVLEPLPRITVRAHVKDTAGEPIAGAHVAVVDAEGTVVAAGMSAEDGAVSIPDVPAGTYTLTATSAEHTATVGVDRAWGPDATDPETLVLGGEGITLAGTVDAGRTLGEHAVLDVLRWSADRHVAFRVPLDVASRFSVRLPAPSTDGALGHLVQLVDEQWGAHHRLSAQGDGAVRIVAIPKVFPPRGVSFELGAAMHLFEDAERRSDTTDLEGFGTAVGDAMVVALGSTSLATREFGSLARRLGLHLVRDMGFDVVALPIAPASADRLDRWLNDRQGAGDRRGPSADWIRAMADSRATVELLRGLYASNRDYENPTSVRLIGLGPGDDGNGQAMASQLLEILAAEPEEGQGPSKVLVLGHNQQVSRAAPMGSALADALGDAYLSVGFYSYQGAFRAVGQGPGLPKAKARHWLAPSGPEFLETVLQRGGAELGFVDLRPFGPDTEVGRWLATPRPQRDLRGAFHGQKPMVHSIAWSDHFDSLVYVESTTQAQGWAGL